MDSRRISKTTTIRLARRLWSIFGQQKLVPNVVEYIKHQREHHKGKSFEAEYFELLKWHEVDIVDEKYLFDN